MVTDVLGLPKTNPSDVGSLTAVVQVGARELGWQPR